MARLRPRNIAPRFIRPLLNRAFPRPLYNGIVLSGQNKSKARIESKSGNRGAETQSQVNTKVTQDISSILWVSGSHASQ